MTTITITDFGLDAMCECCGEKRMHSLKLAEDEKKIKRICRNCKTETVEQSEIEWEKMQ